MLSPVANRLHAVSVVTTASMAIPRPVPSLRDGIWTRIFYHYEPVGEKVVLYTDIVARHVAVISEANVTTAVDVGSDRQPLSLAEVEIYAPGRGI